MGRQGVAAFGVTVDLLSQTAGSNDCNDEDERWQGTVHCTLYNWQSPLLVTDHDYNKVIINLPVCFHTTKDYTCLYTILNAVCLNRGTHTVTTITILN